MERKRIQPLLGTTNLVKNFTGVEGELTFDTDLKKLQYHDGVTKGGITVASEQAFDDFSQNTNQTLGVLQNKVNSNTEAIGTKVSNSDVVDNLDSTSRSKVLSAFQGRVLRASIFGINQSVRDVSSSTVSGTTYTNTDSRLKMISIYTNIISGSTSREVLAYLDGALWGRLDTDSNTDGQITIPVPPSSTWRVTANNLDIGTSIFVKELS